MEGSRDSRSTKQTKDKEVSRGSKSRSLDIIYTNAQSIDNKIDELRSTVCDLNPDLVLIDESWTNKDITKAHLGIDG